MSRRIYWPRLPVRWIHHRRGAARVIQHVVATPPDEHSIWGLMTPTLCGKQLGNGAA